tara:strand:+ start:2850 stop:3023 length:174 start_codon:yes stop_codon:yes gene_type:complete
MPTQLQDELGPRIVEPERESPTAGMSPQQVSDAVGRLMGIKKTTSATVKSKALVLDP